MNRATVVNWKFFYQRRMMWLWYFIMLCQVPAMVMVHREGQVMRPFFLIVSFLAGMVAGSMMKEVTSRPMSYCLPGFAGVPRRAIFGFIGVVNLAAAIITTWSIALLAVEGSLAKVAVVFAAVLMLGMGMSLLSVLFAYMGDHFPSWIGGIWAVIFLGLFYGGGTWVSVALTDYAWAMIGVNAVWAWWMWRYLGRREVTRRICGQEGMTMLDGWNFDKTQRMQAVKAAEKRPGRGVTAGWLERWSLRKMVRSGEMGKACWGAWYAVMDSIMMRSYPMWGATGAAILVYGYVAGNFGDKAENDLTNMVYLLPMMGAMMWIFPVHPTLLTGVGRKERFWGALAAMVGIVMFATVFMGVLAGVMHLIGPYMPDISGWSTQEWSFAVPELSKLYYVPMMMPLGLLVSVLFQRRQAIMMMLGPVLFGICVALSLTMKLTSQVRVGGWVIMAAAVVIWGALLGGLYWRCMKSDLQ